MMLRTGVKTVKLLLIDDHPLVAQGLQAVLQYDSEFELTGFSTNGKDAEALCRDLKPDMVLVDLRLPGESGLDVIRTLRSQGVTAKFVVLTTSSAVSEVREALEIGVDGYVLKEALPDELLDALRRIGQGRKYYDPKAMEGLVQARSPDESLLAQLTEREREVLAQLASGLSNRQIAEKLFITENTVKKHISSILVKLQLSDRTQAALFAVHHGVGPKTAI
jgi:DNA-binding NarL/FixJ family response regulator